MKQESTMQGYEEQGQMSSIEEKLNQLRRMREECGHLDERLLALWNEVKSNRELLSNQSQAIVDYVENTRRLLGNASKGVEKAEDMLVTKAYRTGKLKVIA